MTVTAEGGWTLCAEVEIILSSAAVNDQVAGARMAYMNDRMVEAEAAGTKTEIALESRRFRSPIARLPALS